MPSSSTGETRQTCNGKLCLSYREAREMIRSAHRGKVGHHSKKIPCREYYCQDCGTYHLTSMPYFYDRKKNKNTRRIEHE